MPRGKYPRLKTAKDKRKARMATDLEQIELAENTTAEGADPEGYVALEAHKAEEKYHRGMERAVQELNALQDYNMRVTVAVNQLYAIMTGGQTRVVEMDDPDTIQYLADQARVHFNRLQAELNKRSEAAAQAHQKTDQIRQNAVAGFKAIIEALS